MKRITFFSGHCCLAVAALAMLIAPPLAMADDIDIFTGASAGSAVNPRILIVVDNTSNWARQSQHWPGGLTQGQAEMQAIRTMIASMNDSVNVGLMEFVTGGNGNADGGYIRSAIKPMNALNKASFGSALTAIYNNINASSEKRNSNTAYGNLMYDAYNYYAGAMSTSPSAIVAGNADPIAYANSAGQFNSPIDQNSTCAKDFIIFIGNADASGPTSDGAANTAALAALGGATTQLGLPNFTTANVTTNSSLGNTLQCHASSTAATASLSGYATMCASYTQGCTIGSAMSNTDTIVCPAGTSVYEVIGTNTTLTSVATGTSNVDTGPRNADEWARFLHDKGIPVAGSSIKPSVTTYTIDVYNAQPNATQTALLMSMAKAGGGKYFAARSNQAIVDALKQIVIEIQAVNSSFASTSLPVNASNRSQNENQIFIGMFRPDPDAKQRWFGNVKRYQLISSGANIELGDANGALAVNTVTGFINPCATSYWTSDSGHYWNGLGINPDPAGTCSSGNDAYSDAPDGSQVEKGGAAEILRQGNNPPSTSSSPTWGVNRTIHTEYGAALTPFSVASSGLGAGLVNFISGFDVNNDKGTGSTLTTRPSIHGDVIHSRPLPVNYGSVSGVTIYYGANDGALRAVNAATGAERWAFIAPEFFPRLARLQSNSPLVTYPNRSALTVPMPTARDYFFDGSIGIYQNADNSAVWIFPTMRRGGRMLYALDVSNPNSPRFKWKAGCPHFSDDIGCSPGMAGIGQTWSTPNVAFIKGYSSTAPVLIVGGGYDGCEDGDTPTPACGATKGGIIYILDADTGSVIASFLTARAVAADISLVDIDNDGFPDYAYGADTGGNLYRIDFIDNTSTKTPLARSAWHHKRVAHTSAGYRKFLHAPALLALGTQVYLALGSGDREHPLLTHYPYASVLNRFYVFKDDLTSKAASTDLDRLRDNTGNTDCQAQPVLPGSNLQGWFMNLNQHGQGEQVVTSALIAGGMVTFSTNRPIDASSACSNALGQARGYWLNLFNASGAIEAAGSCGAIRSNTFVGGGLPPSPIMASRVPIGSRSVSVVIGAIQKSGSISVSISPQKIRPVITSKRKRIYTYTSGQ